MKPVVVFRHVDCEGPGYLGTFLEANDIAYDIIRIDAGDPVPDSADTASGLVFMGGHMSVNDAYDWIGREMALIREAMEKDIPVLGHCLGAQLIAASLGATVAANPAREIGWHTVQVPDNAEARGWFGTEAGSFDCFHWHAERFELPNGAVPLLSSRFCDNQAFVLGKTLAMQCHIEMTDDMIRIWSERFSDQLTEPSDSVQSPDQMLANVEEKARLLNRMAERVYSRWITGLK